MTPARLLLVDRQARRMAREGRGALLAGCLGSGMAAPGPEARRLVLEIDLRLGAFVLFGSVSGWLLLVATLVRILWRLRGHAPGDRAEHFVDFSEHVASRLGRRTLRLALLSEGLPEAGPVAGTRP
jgi:hypothetical protein